MRSFGKLHKDKVQAVQWIPTEPAMLIIEDDKVRNASREDQNAAISGLALTVSSSCSCTCADPPAVSAPGGVATSAPRLSLSESASLPLLRRGLDGGSGEEGRSVSDHKHCATVSQSSSSSSDQHRR